MTSRRTGSEAGASLFTAPLSAAKSATFAIQAGIDEAGLGPMLGPLTFGFAAFRVPRASANLWHVLRPVASDSVDDAPGKLVVADSKVVFSRDEPGARRLESTALAFLGVLVREGTRCAPRDGTELCQTLGRDVGVASELCAEHWYAHLPARLPHFETPEVLSAHCDALDATLKERDVALVDAGVSIVPASKLNHSFDRTCNKSLTHWESCVPLLQRVWREHAHDGVELMVDKHGGRARYTALLAELFTDAEVETVKETAVISEYWVIAPPEPPLVGRRMHVRFRERAEQSSFATALASCLAKYTREICMHAFNAYFRMLQPELRPTAGYTTDARRWLTDAAPALARSGLAMDVVVRKR